MIKLINLDHDLLGQLEISPKLTLEKLSINSEDEEFIQNLATQSREYLDKLGCEPSWAGYLAVDEKDNNAVGTCSYKGAPDAEGKVEIAYYTFPQFQKRGIATEMAKELTRKAIAHTEVKKIIAHTMPEYNASTEVLKKAGFELIGDVQDPEDGLVWLWSYRVS